jgi:hypothetical protein
VFAAQHLSESCVQPSRSQRDNESQPPFIAASQPESNHCVMESLAAQLHRSGQDRLHTAGGAEQMVKPVLLGATVVSAIVAAMVAGSGVAQAASSPNVVGQKYSDARGTLTTAGFTIVVSTTVGDQVSWPNCVVTHQQDRSVPAPENTAGSATNETLLSLNCDAQLASATQPGNSLGSPEGQAAAAAAASSSAASAASAAPSS